MDSVGFANTKQERIGLINDALELMESDEMKDWSYDRTSFLVSVFRCKFVFCGRVNCTSYTRT
jgi:hypothetical protein